MIENALIAFSTLVATVGPLESAILFATLTLRMDANDRRRIAIRGTLIATGILLFFALFGEFVLGQLGVTLAALKAAGGMVLMLISLEMIFARRSGGFPMSLDETQEAEAKNDIAVVPLATPIIAGPGAMGGVVLVAANAQGDFLELAVILGVLIGVMFLTLCLLLCAVQLRQYLGDTAVNVVTRVLGIILAALAMQFMFDGIGQSGIFASLLPPTDGQP